MKTLLILILLAAMLAITGGLYAFQQPPAVNVSVATPSTVSVNITTSVTITAQINDSRAIADGVNLLQINPISGSQTVVGTLHDDGVNGDAVAGDHIFSVLIHPSTSLPTLFTYQISAAFRGVLKRSLSGLITVAVVPAGVVIPADPGPAGMLTVAGIDSNGNGIRDDAERLIASFALPSSSEMVLWQQAVVMQNLILGVPTRDSALSLTLKSIVIDRCARHLLDNRYEDLTNSVQAEMLNTTARLAAFLNTGKQAGAWTTEGLPDETAACQALP